MIDENAFGLLLAYLSLEDDEYAGERAEFVERYAAFTALVRGRLTEAPPGASGRAIELGHALYLELLEGERSADLIAWLRELRARLAEAGYETAGILTFGASWVDAGEPRPDVVDLGGVKLLRASGPSEPLRRALLAEARARGDAEADSSGWGPGLYLDVQAVEALGRTPKNAPTILRCGGAEFFRAGS